MKKLLLTMIFTSFISMACVAAVGPHGTGVAIVPPLPLVVELGDPYYVYGGYYYYYHSDRWYYAKSNGGPWIDLPRDHYPREVRFRGKGDERNGPDRDSGDKRDWKQDKVGDHGKDWKQDSDRWREKGKSDGKGKGMKRGQDKD